MKAIEAALHVQLRRGGSNWEGGEEEGKGRTYAGQGRDK